jgi:hypothetical protein
MRIRPDELRRKSALATTMEEIATLNVEAAGPLQQLVKISLAVHTGIPAPHLRLVSDSERVANAAQLVSIRHRRSDCDSHR